MSNEDDSSAIGQIERLRAVRRRMSRRLMAWAIASALAGAGAWVAMYFISNTWTRALLGGLAAQCFVWGAIDSLFAAAGLSQARRPLPPAGDAVGVSRELRDADHLARVLGFSVKLNYVWLAIGAALLVAGVVLRAPALVGHGIGVIVQAGFLFVFDRSFLNAVRRDMPIAPAG